MANEWETVESPKASSDGWETVTPSKKAAKPKFVAQEDTQYSAEGIPTTSAGGSDELPAWAQKIERGVTDVMGAPIRAAASIAKPIAGIAEWMGYGEPAKAVKALDEGIKSRTGIVSSAGSLAGDIAGFGAVGKGAQIGAKALQQIPKVADVASKVSALAPQFLKTPGIASTVAKGAGVGAATGLVEPVGKTIGEEGFAEEKAKQAGVGAVLGAALPAAGAGVARVLNPKLERMKELIASGYGSKENIINSPLTLGQVLGGPASAAEKFLNVLPLSGMGKATQKGVTDLEHKAAQRAELAAAESVVPSKMAPYEAGLERTALKESDRLASEAKLAKTDADIKAAEEAIHAEHGRAYSTPIINEALAPLGKTLPENVHGNKAIDWAADQLETGYKDAYSKMGNIPLTKNIKTELTDFAEGKRLTPDYKNALLDEVDTLVNATSKNQKLKPEDWHAVYSDLGRSIHDARISKVPGSKGYASALEDLRGQWFNLVKDRPGADEFLKLQQASSQLQAPIKAASTLKAVAEQGGMFDPKQFLAGLKADSTQKQFARGAVKRQEEAMEAHKAYVEALKGHKLTAAEKRKAAEEEIRLAKAAREQELAHPEHPINIKERESLAAIKAAEQGKTQPTQDLLSQVKKEGQAGYDLNRLKYLFGVMPLAGPLYHGIQHGAPMAGLVASGQAALAPAFLPTIFGPGLAARGLYSNPAAQKLWKKAAMQRSPAMIQAGKNLEQRIGAGLDVPTSAAALGGARGALLGPSQEENTGEEYASGGLVYLANGGAAKKSSPIVDMRPYVPLSMYRADVAGKFKSPDRLETLPTKIEKDVLENYIKAMRAGEEFGAPQLTPQQIAKMALVEGRGDLGFNSMNVNNPQAHKIASTLVDYGHPDDAAGFAGAILDKQQMAQRKGIPFEHAWNGLGKTKQGKTGADYANKYENIDYALLHPKNAELMKVINSAYQYQTPKPAPSPLESLNPMGDQTGLGYLR